MTHTTCNLVMCYMNPNLNLLGVLTFTEMSQTQFSHAPKRKNSSVVTWDYCNAISQSDHNVEQIGLMLQRHGNHTAVWCHGYLIMQ